MTSNVSCHTTLEDTSCHLQSAKTQERLQTAEFTQRKEYMFEYLNTSLLPDGLLTKLQCKLVLSFSYIWVHVYLIFMKQPDGKDQNY